jgi:excisionase family DNA binding protein
MTPASLPVPDTLHTIPEAARVLRVSVPTMRRLIYRRQIHVVRAGRTIRITGAALRAYVDRHTEAPVAIAGGPRGRHRRGLNAPTPASTGRPGRPAQG